MSREALNKGVSIGEIVRLPVREAIGRFKYLPNDQIRPGREAVERQLHAEIAALVKALEEGDS
jgi:V/A-type H+-transporting ATPase subunit A